MQHQKNTVLPCQHNCLVPVKGLNTLSRNLPACGIQLVMAAGNLITKYAVLPVAPAAWEPQAYEIHGFIKYSDIHLVLCYIVLCPFSNPLLSEVA